MYCALLTLAWFVGTIYATIPLFALIVRPFAKSLRARLSRLLVIIPSWFGMMAVVYFLTWQWRKAVLYRATTAWLAAVFLFAAAILIYPRSRLHLFHIQAVGRRELEPGRERRLITSGIRQHIRHPVYLAHLCMLLALTVDSGEIVLYGVTVFALLTGWPMIRQEEAELEHRFGEEYLSYKRAVPAVLIPPVPTENPIRREGVVRKNPRGADLGRILTLLHRNCALIFDFLRSTGGTTEAVPFEEVAGSDKTSWVELMERLERFKVGFSDRRVDQFRLWAPRVARYSFQSGRVLYYERESARASDS